MDKVKNDRQELKMMSKYILYLPMFEFGLACLNYASLFYTVYDCFDLSSAVVTIGFDTVAYSVLEDTGSVNVTVSVLNGTLARNAVVTLSTESGGTATGKLNDHSFCSMMQHNSFVPSQPGQTTLIQLSP